MNLKLLQDLDSEVRITRSSLKPESPITSPVKRKLLMGSRPVMIQAQAEKKVLRLTDLWTPLEISIAENEASKTVTTVKKFNF
jgi:hypothetical protein